jgi:hypothetical protein
MDQIFAVSFDNLVMASLTCLILREVFLFTLPDHVAGPGGWLINTEPK